MHEEENVKIRTESKCWEFLSSCFSKNPSIFVCGFGLAPINISKQVSKPWLACSLNNCLYPFIQAVLKHLNWLTAWNESTQQACIIWIRGVGSPVLRLFCTYKPINHINLEVFIYLTSNKPVYLEVSNIRMLMCTCTVWKLNYLPLGWWRLHANITKLN